MLLRSKRARAQKLKILALAMLAAFVSGLALAQVIPNVKRLWTASWTLYTTGWVLEMMLLLVVIIDVLGWRKLAFPLIVVGMNSILIYSAGFLVRGSIERMITAFSGGFKCIGALAPVAQHGSVMLVLWYLCYWLYKHKIFIKV